MSRQSPIDITREALVPLGAGLGLEFCYPEALVAAEVRLQVVDGDRIGGRAEVVPEVVVVPREGEARVRAGRLGLPPAVAPLAHPVGALAGRPAPAAGVAPGTPPG